MKHALPVEMWPELLGAIYVCVITVCNTHRVSLVKYMPAQNFGVCLCL